MGSREPGKNAKQGKGLGGDEPMCEGQQEGPHGGFKNDQGEWRMKSYADKCLCKRADVYLLMQSKLFGWALPWVLRMDCRGFKVTENADRSWETGPSV